MLLDLQHGLTEPLHHEAPAVETGPRSLRPMLTPRTPGLSGEVAAADPRPRALFETHYDFVWRSLRALGVSAASLDDGTQQVFWLAFQKLDQMAPGSERPFLYRLATGIASNARRSVRRNREVNDDTAFESHADPAVGPEEAAAHGEARGLLEEVLASMPGDLRMVFVLFELEEMEVPEIAASLEIPHGTVSSRLRRAREKFQIGLKRVRRMTEEGRGR